MTMSSVQNQGSRGMAVKRDRNVATTKVIIRGLPPLMSQTDFMDQISPISKHDYFHFVKADLSLGINAFSRAYINFLDEEDVLIFKDKFDGYIFLDQKGCEYPAIVEFAPFQKVPKRRPRKVDLKNATIFEDDDYKQFLEQLTNPEPITLPNIENFLEDIEARDKETKGKSGYPKITTPLIEYIKQRKLDKQPDVCSVLKLQFSASEIKSYSRINNTYLIHDKTRDERRKKRDDDRKRMKEEQKKREERMTEKQRRIKQAAQSYKEKELRALQEKDEETTPLEWLDDAIVKVLKKPETDQVLETKKDKDVKKSDRASVKDDNEPRWKKRYVPDHRDNERSKPSSSMSSANKSSSASTVAPKWSSRSVKQGVSTGGSETGHCYDKEKDGADVGSKREKSYVAGRPGTGYNYKTKSDYKSSRNEPKYESPGKTTKQFSDKSGDHYSDRKQSRSVDYEDSDAKSRSGPAETNSYSNDSKHTEKRANDGEHYNKLYKGETRRSDIDSEKRIPSLLSDSDMSSRKREDRKVKNKDRPSIEIYRPGNRVRGPQSGSGKSSENEA